MLKALSPSFSVYPVLPTNSLTIISQSVSQRVIQPTIHASWIHHPCRHPAFFLAWILIHPSSIYPVSHPSMHVHHSLLHLSCIRDRQAVGESACLKAESSELCTYLYSYTVMFTFAALIIIIMHTKLNTHPNTIQHPPTVGAIR